MSIYSFINSLQPGAPLAGFLPCNLDDENDVKYYGFMAMNGSFYIQRQNIITKAFGYYYGETGFAAAWTDRAGKTYTYPDGSAL